MTPDLLPARMARRIIVGPEGCWEWTGARASNGYGSVGYMGKVGSAHRVAYTLLVGEVPGDLQLDHLCRVRHCCNPTHLEPVTPSVNQRRAKSLIDACPKGHAYTPENTRTNPRGWRSCLECNREGVRRWRRARKAATP
jgi:hypothetical protein